MSRSTPLLPLSLGACALFAAAPAQAQQSYGGLPVAEWAEFEAPLQTVEAPLPDVAAYRAEDEARGHRPLRYGALVPTPANFESHGAVEFTPDGTLVWRLRFEAPGAESVALEFAQFELPPGGQLFVYDDARTTVRGAYTDANHQLNDGFVFSPVPGDSLVLEYSQPAVVQGRPRIEISTLIYDYRNVFNLQRRLDVSGSGGPDGNCLVDVNCPDGAGYEQQIRGTMRTLSGGGLCSGALINNTSGDGTQYVLTADHCGQSGNTVFTFNYERSGCGSGSAPQNQTVSGCTVLTSNSTFDNRLLRINNPIPDSYEPVWLGWSRSSFNTVKAAAIGHPSGGPKSISIDSNGTSKENNMWRVFWNIGMLEGGNSGGPLIDNNGRVKGPACCVTNFTCGSQTAWFGRFDRFWTTNNLAQWLDPLGTDPNTLDLYDPYTGSGGPPVITSSSPASVPAVVVDGRATVALAGTGMLGVSQVDVNGVALPSALWSKAGDTSLTLSFDPQPVLGPLDITLTGPAGNTTTQVTVEANWPPVIDMQLSDPEQVLSVVPFEVTFGAKPGDIYYALGSLSDTPTFLPGLADLALGNGGLQISVLATRVIPTSGHDSIDISLFGLGIPPASRIHVQGAVVDSSTFALPAISTNLQSTTLLF